MEAMSTYSSIVEISKAHKMFKAYNPTDKMQDQTKKASTIDTYSRNMDTRTDKTERESSILETEYTLEGITRIPDHSEDMYGLNQDDSIR